MFSLLHRVKGINWYLLPSTFVLYKINSPEPISSSAASAALAESVIRFI